MPAQPFWSHRLLLWTVSLVLLLSVVASVPACSAASEQKYPSRPVEVIVTFAAGGPADLVARIVSEFLTKEWGQSLEVVNKPGGSSVTGTMAMLNSAPDGHTVLLHAVAVTLNTVIQSDVHYKWDDPVPLGLFMKFGGVFVVPADSPWKTMKEAMAAIKADPKGVRLGIGGVSSPSNFRVATLLDMNGIDPNAPRRVLFDGDSPLLAAIAGGNADIGQSGVSSALPLIQAKKLRPLAVTTSVRYPELPDVPTLTEAGFPLESTSWDSFSAPPKTPDYVVKKWAEGLKKASQDPEVIKKIQGIQGIVTYLDPDATKKFWEEERNAAMVAAQKLGLRK